MDDDQRGIRENDRRGRMMGSKGEFERMWCEGKRRSLKEEEFYGEGKEIQGGKRRR